MLWAQHADASTSPKRPEQSKVICLCVIVFDCWQLRVRFLCMRFKSTGFPTISIPEAFIGRQCHGGQKHKALQSL